MTNSTPASSPCTPGTWQMPAEMRPTSPPFAEAVEVATDAPAIERLVAWTGRQP